MINKNTFIMLLGEETAYVWHKKLSKKYQHFMQIFIFLNKYSYCVHHLY